MTERSSAAGSRFRTPLVIAATVIGVALPLIVAIAALAGRRWYPVLDLAMTEFRISDVGTRQTPLIGLPGRIGELPDQGSHPGPLSFWLLAPGYRLFGGSAWSMEVATVTLQLAWISVALWIGHRRLGRVGLATVAFVIAILIRGYGLTTLVQPWNPYMPLLAWLVILLATWSVFCRDHSMLVPLVIAASFCAQTHIPYLLMAGALGLVSIGLVLTRWWRDRSEAEAEAGRRPPTAVLVTVGAFVVLWLGPFADQVRRDPGNLRRLLDHFGSPPEEAIGFGTGARLLLRHLDLVDGYARLLTGDQQFLEVIDFRRDGRIWTGVILLLVWLGSAVIARRLEHGPLMRLHALLGLTLVLSWISMSRIFGQAWFYLMLWAWVTTTLLLVSIVWTALAWFRERAPDRASLVNPARLAIGIAMAAVLVTLSSTIVAPSTDHPEEYLGDTVGEVLQPTIEALRAGVGASDGPDGKYVVQFKDAYFFGSQAFAMVNELERAGLDAGMYEYWRVPITSKRVITIDEATAEVIFATGVFVDQWRADDRVVEVAFVDPRTPEERIEYERFREALIATLVADDLSELVDAVDTNLFGLQIDQRISNDARAIADQMSRLGQQTAVFIGPPGVTL